MTVEASVDQNQTVTEFVDTTHLQAKDRPIGGLGVFMVKKSMDDVSYSYRDGKNILTIRKRI